MQWRDAEDAADGRDAFRTYKLHDMRPTRIRLIRRLIDFQLEFLVYASTLMYYSLCFICFFHVKHNMYISMHF